MMLQRVMLGGGFIVWAMGCSDVKSEPPTETPRPVVAGHDGADGPTAGTGGSDAKSPIETPPPVVAGRDGASEPTAGTGGMPSAATSAESCVTSSGGACADACDYVSVEFSEPLPASNLELEVTTSQGDVLMPKEDAAPSFNTPALMVNASPDGSQALGFRITMQAGQNYSPEWVDVVLRRGDHTAADSRLSLMYSCAPIRCQWCWRAKPVSLQVTMP